MKILSLEEQPFHTITYEAVDKSKSRVAQELQVLGGTVDFLPPDVEAVALVGDQQGREDKDNGGSGVPRLLGEVLADELALLSERGELPPLSRVQVLGTGDWYIPPELDRRSGNGDVRSVWRALARCCRGVLGVVGNHDAFGSVQAGLDGLRGCSGCECLDGGVAGVGGLRVGGVSGVIGDTRRPFRKSEGEFLARMRQVLGVGVDVLLLHEGPCDDGCGLPGNPLIRDEIAKSTRGLVCCFGHANWREPLKVLPGGAQLLNLEGRVVVLTRPKLGTSRAARVSREQPC